MTFPFLSLSIYLNAYHHIIFSKKFLYISWLDKKIFNGSKLTGGWFFSLTLRADHKSSPISPNEPFLQQDWYIYYPQNMSAPTQTFSLLLFFFLTQNGIFENLLQIFLMQTKLSVTIFLLWVKSLYYIS